MKAIAVDGRQGRSYYPCEINPTPWSVKIRSYETDYGDDNGEFHQAASIIDAKGNYVARGLKVETARLIADSVNSLSTRALAEEQPADPKAHLRQIETEVALLSKRLAEKKRDSPAYFRIMAFTYAQSATTSRSSLTTARTPAQTVSRASDETRRSSP